MTMDVADIFTRDPDILSGATVFTGTRVPLEALFENLSDGMSLNDFLRNFPTVDPAQAKAALQQAGEDWKRRVA